VAATGTTVRVVTPNADDRWSILDLITRADDAATRRDVEGYVALFSQDGVLDGEKGEHRGRRELARAVGPVWASEGTASRHLTLNVTIDPVAGQSDRAVATSTLLIVDPGPPPVPLTVTTVVQHVDKTPQGWRITRRSVGGG
jgi:SnoaL-like domain